MRLLSSRPPSTIPPLPPFALPACGSYDDTAWSGADDERPVSNDNDYENQDPHPEPEENYADAGTSPDDYGAEPPPLNAEHPTFEENDFIDTAEENTSTFSVDVNTASYTYTRGQLNSGRLPQPDQVRIEEFINFFRFDYPEPHGGERFSKIGRASCRER